MEYLTKSRRRHFLQIGLSATAVGALLVPALVNLVDTLLNRLLQHAAGSRQAGDDRQQTIAAMKAFVTMYRPHAAREDTDLFPKLREIVSAHEFDSIGEDMEKAEKQKFGADGFEKVVMHVSELERTIGIADLNQFTPAA